MEIAKTADQALIILLALGNGRAQTPTELAAATGLNRTVVHRLLATLHARGFTQRHGEAYAVGPALVQLAAQYEPALRAVAHPVMAELSAQLGETVILAVVDGQEAVVVDQVIATNLVRVQYDLGYRHPLHLGATGLILLAHCPAVVIDRTAVLADNPAQLRRRLAQARKAGYIRTANELRSGATGTAVPVRDAGGGVVAAIAAVAPLTRSSTEDHAGRLMAGAARIEAELQALSVQSQPAAGGMKSVS